MKRKEKTIIIEKIEKILYRESMKYVVAVIISIISLNGAYNIEQIVDNMNSIVSNLNADSTLVYDDISIKDEISEGKVVVLNWFNPQ
ncbi:MAG: hypothetical protein JW870_08365 [Candidatus Delongbacteria bacterium]|nr:hypothetical protein [Candidatus Delongbacteria bacterium]